MQVDDLLRAVKSAENFVKKQLTPADLVAIATYSSDLRVAQNFTNDRDELYKAVDAIRVGESSSLADQGGAGAAGGTSATGEEVVTQDTSEAFTPDETEFNIFNTDEKLRLGADPGRRLQELHRQQRADALAGPQAEWEQRLEPEVGVDCPVRLLAALLSRHEVGRHRGLERDGHAARRRR